MAGRDALRDQQRAAAAAIKTQVDRISPTANPRLAREARDVIVEAAERIVSIADVLAREGG